MAASLSFDTASRHVKRGELAPVYLLTGDEDVLKEEFATLVLDQAVDPSCRDFNVDVRAAADLDGEALHALVETPPMLADRRVVLVRNLEQWRKNAGVWHVLDRYLDRPSPTTILILTLGAGEKPRPAVVRNSVNVQVRPLTPDRLVKWVHWRAGRAGLELERTAAEHLVRSVGGDLAVLTMEIEKLAAVATGGEPLGVEAVANLVGVRRGETPRDWIAAVLGRDVPRAVEMLGQVLAAAGVTAVRLVSDLGTALVGVRIARALADSGMPGGRIHQAVFEHIRAARPVGLGSWRDEAGEWTRWARGWTAASLDRALRAAYETDQALKASTIADDRGIVTDMLLRLGAREAAA